MRLLTLLLLAAAVPAFGQPVDLSTIRTQPIERQVSYILAHRAGKEMRTDTVSGLSIDVFVAALRAGYDGAPNPYSEAEQQEVLRDYQTALEMRQLRQQAASSPEAAAYLDKLTRNQAAADSFLTANAARDSIQTLEGGVQYQVLVAGTGAKPQPGQSVTIHYEGKLLDGTVFDSSYERGEPATFGVDGVIPGFSQALQAMPIGSTWRVFIPPHLAYGMQGAGQEIGPNALLIFKIELQSAQDG